MRLDKGNVFKKRKKLLNNQYTTHKDYEQQYTREAIKRNFSLKDLERIQNKANNMHWLSAIQESERNEQHK